MDEWMKIILSLSLSGSLLFLLLMLGKPLYKKRFRKGFQYYLWIVIIARLLLPFTPAISFVGNVFYEIDRSISQTNKNSISAQKQMPVSSAILPDTKPEAREAENSPEKETDIPPILPHETFLSIIIKNTFYVWLIAALIFLIRKITIYQGFVKYIRAGCTAVDEIVLLEKLGELVKEYKIRQTIELSINPLVSSPLLVGFIKPCIVLPSTCLSVRDFENTIRHELTHYHRGDMFYKWLVQLTVSLHWFNPLVYFMEREISRACELSCDESVMQKLSADEQKSYGNTLIHAIGTGGSYRDSFASLTLYESKKLLKERLGALMAYQKKSRLNKIISIMFAIVICCLAAATGAYASNPSPSLKQSSAALLIPSKNNISSENMIHYNHKKEYTLQEINALDISGIAVEAFSETVSIKRGGDRVTFECDTGLQDAYTLQIESDGGGTRQNLCLTRTASFHSQKNGGISITIPDELSLKLIKVVTESGNINFENCDASMLLCAETKSGQVMIQGGTASALKVETESGNALIIEPSLVENRNYTYFETKTGTIAFQPKDAVQNYQIIVDTGAESQIIIDGESYSGGDYSINETGTKKIAFDSESGSLMIQEQAAGNVLVSSFSDTISASSISTSSGNGGFDNQYSLNEFSSYSVAVSPAEPNKKAEFSMVQKEYTAEMLQELDITGIYIKLPFENIVVSQEGTSLVFRYPQAFENEYQFTSRKYQLYEDGYGPESQAGMPGTIEQLIFTRTDSSVPDQRAKTIYVTLPADPKLNRVIKIVSETGDIHIQKCLSTDFLNAMTKSGNIYAEASGSPRFVIETGSGQITVNHCSANELITEAISGCVNIKLSSPLEQYLEQYRLSVDTDMEAKILVNGKSYQGGSYLLNPHAKKDIQFHSRTGSFTIQD